VKTCQDNFIIIRESNVSSISQDSGCAYISGPSENMTQLADGFLLKVIGVQ
jgi:hypothetical protein